MIDTSVLLVEDHTSERGQVVATVEISTESMYSMDSSIYGNSIVRLDEDR